MLSICLTCGSEGYPEWLVFCNKCQACALHRYCLDGPMIIHDDVTWFCDDCEPRKPPPLENLPLPCRSRHNRKLEKETIPAYLKLKNHIKRMKKNFRRRQKIMKKQKELKDTSGYLDQPEVELSNCSSSTSHCGENHLKNLKDNNHKEQNNFLKKHKETSDISSYVSIRQESSPDCITSNHDGQSSKPCDQTLCSDKEQDVLMEKHKETAGISSYVSIRQESSPDCVTSNHDRIQSSKPCDQILCSDKKQNMFMEKHKETADISGYVRTSQELSPYCYTSNHDRIPSSKPCDQTLCSDKEQNTFMEKHKEQKFMKKHKETADISSYVSISQESDPYCYTSNHDRIRSSKPCDQTLCTNKEQRKFMEKHEEQKRHKEQEKFTMKRKRTADISPHVIISSDSSECHTSNHNQVQCSDPCALTQCGDNFQDTANSNKASDYAQNSGTSLNKNSNIFELNYRGNAQPVARPIWRGSFFISNRGFSGPVRGLAAHASTLACSKVLDEAKRFPDVLCADLMKRSAVWPKGFKGSGPTTESIALYIFPETERDEKTFDKLVSDTIFLNLAIRVELVNANLLVFPSTALPTGYWRYNSKYYLWGVFRSKQSSKAN